MAIHIRVAPISNDSDEVMIIETHTYKRFWFFGKVITKQYMYRGSCTVWDHWPSGIACDTLTDEWCYAIWKEWKRSKQDAIK